MKDNIEGDVKLKNLLFAVNNKVGDNTSESDEQVANVGVRHYCVIDLAFKGLIVSQE